MSLQALPGNEYIAMLANTTTLAYLKHVLLVWALMPVAGRAKG